MTPAQHTALARLSDGEWHRMEAAPAVIGALYRAGYIREDMSANPMRLRLWTITCDGLAALERVSA